MPVEYVSLVNDSFIFPEKEFGITGTGNETSLLQAAIDAASAQGRILVLPPFPIIVTTLTIPTNGVRIWGQSGTGNRLSVLQSTGINAPIISIPNGVNFFEIDNVKIVGTSAGASQHGIHSTSTSSLFRMSNLVIENCGGNGIHITGQTFSCTLGPNIYSSNNNLNGFYIDAVNAPCVRLVNCYAGIVAVSKYGYFINSGIVEMENCNSLDGTNNTTTCLGIGQNALAVCRNCNFESYKAFGVWGDVGADVQLYNCNFVPDGGVTTQAIFLSQTLGRSYIDESCTFQGGTNDNASNLPIKIFSRTIDSPTGYGLVTGRGLRVWNSQDGREEPMFNSGNRLPIQTVTAASYTETMPYASYIGVNRAGAVSIILYDPQSSEVVEGRPIIVKDESGGAGANNITITTVNNRTIDGAASKVINTNYGVIRLVKRGNNYWVI